MTEFFIGLGSFTGMVSAWCLFTSMLKPRDSEDAAVSLAFLVMSVALVVAALIVRAL